MTIPHSERARQIADTLTKAQREAIRNAGHAGFGYHADALMHAGRSQTGRALFDRGLVKFTGILSPLGLEVRQILQESPPQ